MLYEKGQFLKKQGWLSTFHMATRNAQADNFVAGSVLTKFPFSFYMLCL